MAKFGDESDSESNPMDWDGLVKEEDARSSSDGLVFTIKLIKKL